MSIGERAMHAEICGRWERAGGWRGVVVGPGDDAAVVEGGGGVRWLLTTDQLVETRHYEPGTPAERVGYKAVARSVSDIAAMAGEPSYALATALIPENAADQTNAMFDAMDHAARDLGCPLVGGDIASYRGTALVLSTTVVGEAHSQRGAVLRSTAKPGDHLYVSGCIGGANQPAGPAGEPRHLCFPPRVRTAWVLADMLGTRLHAMIDLSDGLGLDTQRLAEASRVAIDIHAPDIPLYPGVTDWHAAAAQGEDYELLFTSPALPEEVIAAGESVGVSMTRIGEVHEGADAAFIEGEHRTPATDLGFLH